MRLIKASLLVAVLALATAPVAHAGDMTFGLGGGLAWPSGDFSDFAKMGWNGNVYGDYWVKPMVSIGVDVDGNFFSAKDDVKNGLKAAFPAYPDPKATADLIGGLVHVNYVFMGKEKVEPWVQGGLGFYNVKTKVEDSDPVLANFDNSESDFGYRLGAGADWKTSPTMKFGIDGKWTGVSTKDKSTNFFGVGLHLTFMTNGATK